MRWRVALSLATVGLILGCGGPSPIVGTWEYASKDDQFWGKTHFDFRENGTYTQTDQGGDAGQPTKFKKTIIGEWKLEGETLELSPKSGAFQVLRGSGKVEDTKKLDPKGGTQVVQFVGEDEVRLTGMIGADGKPPTYRRLK